MKFTTSLAVVATAVGFATAMPAPEPQFPALPANTVYYYFKTKVQADQAPKYNNLYLTAYHTGAGLSDATFSGNTPLPAHRGWFNGSSLNWFEPSDKGGVFFGVNYNVGGTNYAAWSPVTINGGTGNPGLKLANEKLLVPDNTNFDSWLVCDWWHSVPQLFTLAKYGKPVIPPSCAKVDLVAEVAPPVASSTA